LDEDNIETDLYANEQEDTNTDNDMDPVDDENTPGEELLEDRNDTNDQNNNDK
jgi:hypothetical protein